MGDYENDDSPLENETFNASDRVGGHQVIRDRVIHTHAGR